MLTADDRRKQGRTSSARLVGMGSNEAKSKEGQEIDYEKHDESSSMLGIYVLQREYVSFEGGVECVGRVIRWTPYAPNAALRFRLGLPRQGIGCWLFGIGHWVLSHNATKVVRCTQGR